MDRGETPTRSPAQTRVRGRTPSTHRAGCQRVSGGTELPRPRPDRCPLAPPSSAGSLPPAGGRGLAALPCRGLPGMRPPATAAPVTGEHRQAASPSPWSARLGSSRKRERRGREAAGARGRPSRAGCVCAADRAPVRCPPRPLTGGPSPPCPAGPLVPCCPLWASAAAVPVGSRHSARHRVGARQSCWIGRLFSSHAFQPRSHLPGHALPLSIPVAGASGDGARRQRPRGGRRGRERGRGACKPPDGGSSQTCGVTEAPGPRGRALRGCSGAPAPAAWPRAVPPVCRPAQRLAQCRPSRLQTSAAPEVQPPSALVPGPVSLRERALGAGRAGWGRIPYL